MSIIYVLDYDLTAHKALERALPRFQLRFFRTAQELTSALAEKPEQRGFVRGFLCDLSQEKQNAYVFSHWLKSSIFKDLPLVWLSSRISWAELQFSLAEGGGQDCFFKPFVPQVLQQFAVRNFDRFQRFETV